MHRKLLKPKARPAARNSAPKPPGLVLTHGQNPTSITATHGPRKTLKIQGRLKITRVGTTRSNEDQSPPEWGSPDPTRIKARQSGDHQIQRGSKLSGVGTTRSNEHQRWPEWGPPDPTNINAHQSGDHQTQQRSTLAAQDSPLLTLRMTDQAAKSIF
jgi:hypothetical protein